MKSNPDKLTPELHTSMIESLPWLVIGTLDDARAAAADQHVQDCGECREWLAFDGALTRALQHDRSVDYAPHAAYARLARRLDIDDARQKRWQSWRRFFTLPPRTVLARPLHLLVAAQTAIIVLLAAGLSSRQDASPPAGEYRTLSQPEPAAGSGVTLRVVIDDAMSASELRELLQDIRGRIVAGPSELGVLTIAIDTPANSRAPDPLALAKQLRDLPHVRFAEPVESMNR